MIIRVRQGEAIIVSVSSACLLLIIGGLVAFVTIKKGECCKPSQDSEDRQEMETFDSPGNSTNVNALPPSTVEVRTQATPEDVETLDVDVDCPKDDLDYSPLDVVTFDKCKWELPRHHLKEISKIGEGNFGQVWKYEATKGVPSFSSKTAPMMVAVKTLKSNATEEDKSDLLNEISVMKMLDPHPNVVRLLGCCTWTGT